MERVQSILDHLRGKVIKEQYAILETFKHSVSPQLFEMIKEIYYKNKTLFIETKDPMWASQLIYYKSEFLKKLREHHKDLRDIKIIAGYDSQQEQTSPENRCRRCGSRVIEKNQQECAVCLYASKEEKRLRIWKVLKETPWIRFEDWNKKDKRNISYLEFTGEKAFQIQQLYDTINQCCREYHRERRPSLLGVIKEKIEEYVLLKLGIQPEHLNETMVQQHVSATLYKYYQMKEKKEESFYGERKHLQRG